MPESVTIFHDIHREIKTIIYPSTTTIENWQRGRRIDVLCSQLRWLIFNAHRSLDILSGMTTWRLFTRPSLRIEPPATNIWLFPVMHVPAQLSQLPIITTLQVEVVDYDLSGPWGQFVLQAPFSSITERNYSLKCIILFNFWHCKTYHHHHYSACTISVHSSACYQ